MPARIHQHVRERVPHLPRRAQDVEVKAIGEHGPAPLEHSVHGSREARSDRFHSRSEMALARRFDNGVEMVVLNRIVNQSEALAVARLSEAALQLTNQPHRSQRRQPAAHLQGDMARKSRRQRFPRSMRVSRIRAALAARARASSAPAIYLPQIEIELTSLPRHDLHCDMQL